MNYFHGTLLAHGFQPVRPDFYVRPASGPAGKPLYCSINEGERPRQLLLWQPGRVLLQGDAVTLAALEQVLARVLQRENPPRPA